MGIAWTGWIFPGWAGLLACKETSFAFGSGRAESLPRGDHGGPIGRPCFITVRRSRAADKAASHNTTRAPAFEVSRRLCPGFSDSSATARRQYEKRNSQVGETGDERFTQTEGLWLPARQDRGRLMLMATAPSAFWTCSPTERLGLAVASEEGRRAPGDCVHACSSPGRKGSPRSPVRCKLPRLVCGLMSASDIAFRSMFNDGWSRAANQRRQA